MSDELYWLTLTALATALMWIPYIVNRILVRGVVRAIGNPRPDDLPHSPWAERALAAHINAAENIGVFAALVLVAHLANASTPTTAFAAMMFFFLRLGHYFVYIIGIPGARTLTFVGSWICLVVLALGILGAA